MPRLALACALALVACDSTGSATGPHDAGVDADDADADAPPLDDAALPDAPPDAPPLDLTPPGVLAIEPADGAALWLHDRVRIALDEPIALDLAAATASIDGAALDVQLVADGDRAVIARLPPGARGVGTLELAVNGVRDLAGNAAAPVMLQYTIAPWHRPAIDRGVAAGAPALAVGGDGAVVAAWRVGSPGARRAVIARHALGAWQTLGDPLGGGDVTAVAVGLAPSDRPVAAWIEGGVAHTARWDADHWTALPSLGSASAIAIDGAPPTVVVAGGGGAQLYQLAGDQWAALGSPLAVAGAPALAVPGADRAVLGWIAGGRLHVARYDGAWAALPAIAVSGAARISVAARGDTVAIAWDEVTGSAGVYAARSTGGAWTRLGGALDVDVQGDASAPAIALDGDAPVVAWRERIETAERGVIARWAGGRWTIVGGHTWLPDGSAPPAAPTLALGPGGAPVVGWAAAGAIGVARFNGPRTAPLGLAARAPLDGCAFSAASPPARLMQTGCFTLAAPGKPAPHPGLVPYDLIAELWSDGAKKRRWIALAPGATMTMTSTGAWAPPVGGFVVKEFAIETTPGNPATRHVVETRFLIRTASGWQGFTYQWRDNGLDADLLNDGVYYKDWPLDDGTTYTHVYPSRTWCVSCHEASYGPLLGLRPQQLRRWFDYDGVIADQLATLVALDVGPNSNATPFAAPHDASQPLERRVRGYFAANCPHCHNPNHIAIKDLRYPTPLAQTRLCEAITPGAPADSRLYQLISSRPGMPALATLQPDPLAVDLVGRWITQLSACP